MALKNEQYNQILREYDNRMFQNKHEQTGRRALAYKKIPALKDLEDQLISISAESGRKAIMGDKAALDGLKEKAIDIKAQQIELLLIHNLSADFLELHYHCEKCQDTGHIGNEKCKCFKQAIADFMYTGSNIRDILKDENFNKFSFDYYSDDTIDPTTGLSPRSNTQKIVAYAKSFIKNFDKAHDNLLFLGNTGVGKTFLANCIAKELLDRGYTVIYLTAFRLFEILEKHKFGRDENSTYNAANQFEYILDCDLLIIDDLGTELANSFTTSQLYLIINERLLKQRSTIISTNLSLDNLNTNYSERIYSRIISSYTIRRIVGEDIRMYKVLHNHTK